MENKTASDYRFYAFISYSRKNEVWAKWLQKKLELYRLPSVLQKQNSRIPKKLKIFRDKTDIGVGGTVEHALAKEIQASKKLIVICSPASAKSDYVEYEVASFLKLGRNTNDILPFIVEGKVSPNSPNHCYTPLLTNLNLNASDVAQDGKNNAFIRLLASLLEINYDDLKQREKTRLIRRASLIGATSFFAFASFTVVAWYFIPHTKYYSDYTTYWEIPEGIKDFKLSKREIALLPFHYEITTRCFRPIKLVYANSCGIPVPQNSTNESQNRPSTAFYSYKNPYLPTKDKKNWELTSALCTYYDGDVSADVQKSCSVKIKYTKESDKLIAADFYYAVDENIGKSLFNDVLSDKCLFFSDVIESENLESIDFKTPEQEFFENCGAIYRYKTEYDNKGLTKKVSFYNKNNHTVSDRNHISGFENSYDEYGRLVLQSYVYSELASLSVCKKRIRYDYDSVNEIIFYDKNDVPVQNIIRSYSSAKINWNKNESGFSCSARFFDEACEPSVSRTLNCSSLKTEFNENGFTKEQVFHRVKKQDENLPAFVKKLHSQKKEPVLKNIFINNSKGVPVEVQKYSDDVLKEKLHITYDDNLYVEKKERLNGDDEVLLTLNYSYQNKSAYAYKTISKKMKNETSLNEYDSCGRLLSQKHTKNDGTVFDTKIAYYGGNKIIKHFKNGAYSDRNGFANAQFSYTNDGMLYFVQFFNSEGDKARSSKLRFSEYTALYTPNSLLVYESFKDQNGKLTAPDDYAYYEAKQNLEDTIILDKAYYMPDGTLTKKRGE